MPDLKFLSQNFPTAVNFALKNCPIRQSDVPVKGFAALSVVVNVAQVLEYGFKPLRKSRNLRDVGVPDPELDNGARRVRTIAASLSAQTLLKSHEGLQDLALQCVIVSAESIEELDALKVVDPKSK
ncbi:hypothetical protein F5B22DRAFT_647938 [Xylaria bambusicola]|uniref:uncharacterized protein n=1 Tax=Xylaria bambusicola TaxID=326684 RepID=UPI0020080482|nr:uncharacterized protein F5B22DRAFT_647938 [Xylaria bambusicola]KAI0513124.1 hypothetical protein F5B22DRAFT_647938 [Xylaria bambusicola]